MAQAFEGIQVVDFSQVLAGPVATQQMAVLGANVIKIERPGTGDQMASLMGSDVHGDAGRSPPFLTANMGKRSITLDLKSPQATEIVTRMIHTADVLVENFAAGVMERLGFGYEAVRALNPTIVYCSISGYGQTGPKAGVAAYDGAIQAASGMMSVTGHPDTGPVRTGYMPVDLSTGLNAAFAIAAALFRRAVTGEGQHLDVAMMDTAVFVQAPLFVNYMNLGQEAGLLGNQSVTGCPTANVFPVKDGFLQVTALRDHHVERLFKVLGKPEVLDDPRFQDEPARRQNIEALQAIVVEVLSADTAPNWRAKLVEAGVPCAEVLRIAEVVEDEQFRHRNVFADIPVPGSDGKTMRAVTAGYMASADGPIPHPAPGLGEHTEEVLAEFGYSAEEIEGFRAAGVL